MALCLHGRRGEWKNQGAQNKRSHPEGGEPKGFRRLWEIPLEQNRVKPEITFSERKPHGPA